MHNWDPAQYLKFSDHRLRPALDLMAQIPLATCMVLWDLGCGPGNITQMLAERWPQAEASGFDSSPEMLAKARAIKDIAWVQGDIAQWNAPVPADLVFSNAALHWVPDHA
ncbi:MAG: methyltransferase domain-containing protein, partial [Proteobacteria bacterium]|nr:methyltransferase domain-containing protein [Pseudomonadota bacterium]